MVTHSAVVTGNLQETTIAFSNGTIADLLRPPLPPKWVSKMHPNDQLCDACCHLANMIEDIDKSRTMLPFAKLLWPLQFFGTFPFQF